MGKRVLVTGASGFVGANLVRRVLRDGHDVHVLLRRPQAWRLLEIANDIRVHQGNLDDPDSVRTVVAGARPEWVFHLAAYGAYSQQTDFSRMVATNLVGCATLLDACADAGVEAFVHAGSSSEYGYKRAPSDEETLVEPNSHYAIAKAAASHYCRLTARDRDLHATTARLYSIYGPYEEPTRLIPTLLMHALRNQLPPLVSPRTARDFVYVDDAVDAMLAVAAAPEIPRGAIFNVCTGILTTIEQIVATVRRLLAVSAEPLWGTMESRAWDTDVWVGSPVTMERTLGWRARTDLSSGLARTVDWLQAHPQWARYYSTAVFGEA